MKKVILLIVIAIFMVIPITFWARTLSSGLPLKAHIYDAGRLLAIVGFVLILFQFVLSSRVKSIEKGIGLDKLFSIHKKLGVAGFIFVLIHPTLLFISGYFGSFSLLKILGLLSLIAICTTALTAILYRRLRLKYEIWKNIHRANYAVFPIAFIHSFRLGSDLHNWWLRVMWLIMLCIYLAVLIYRTWNWSYVRKHPFNVAEVIQETYDTWSLYFDGKHRDYRPGQFMIVQLVRDGKVSEPHPFTISSSPTWDSLSISVKSVGDFTATISKTKTSDRAYIDAPYGAFSFLNHDDHDLILIAGGIGITPFMSMLRYIYDRELKKSITLIWGNKTEKDIIFKDELEKMSGEMPSLKVVHVLSKQENWTGEKGYIDAEKLKKYIGNFQTGQFFICGPPIMMSLVIKALRRLGVPKKRIHYERFAIR